MNTLSQQSAEFANAVQNVARAAARSVQSSDPQPETVGWAVSVAAAA